MNSISIRKLFYKKIFLSNLYCLLNFESQILTCFDTLFFRYVPYGTLGVLVSPLFCTVYFRRHFVDNYFMCSAGRWLWCNIAVLEWWCNFCLFITVVCFVDYAWFSHFDMVCQCKYDQCDGSDFNFCLVSTLWIY